ncbi:MAG: transglutaminase family protein [Floccifex sp.]
MKQLQIQYSLSFQFSKPVNHHYFHCMCLPGNDPRQRVIQNKMYIDADFYSILEDGLKNKVIYGYKEKEHKELYIHVQSVVEVDWNKYDQNQSDLYFYTMETIQTKWNEAFLELEDKVYGNDYEKTLMISKIIYEQMKYEKNSTNLHTTSLEAWTNKKGVCQDYAHILMTVLRHQNIPCRYVAGVLLNESLTHAWVEFFVKDRWYGIDPTNNCLVDDTYISFGKGRDCQDVLVNKGIFFGQDVKQNQSIQIEVEEWK